MDEMARCTFPTTTLEPEWRIGRCISDNRTSRGFNFTSKSCFDQTKSLASTSTSKRGMEIEDMSDTLYPLLIVAK